MGLVSGACFADRGDDVLCLDMRALYAPIQRNHDRLSTGIPSADALVIVTEWREFRSPNFDTLKAKLKSLVNQISAQRPAVHSQPAPAWLTDRH